MAGSALGELVLKFSADISDILSGVQRMQSELADFSSGVSGAFSDFKSAIGDVADALVALAAADYFGKLITGAIDAGAELQRLSESTGLSVEMMSSFKNAMAETGESSDNSSRMLQTFERNLQAATSGTGKAADALNALGLNAQKLASETPDQALMDFATAISAVGDGSGKTAVAMASTGRGGATLLPTMANLAESGNSLATISQQGAENSLALEAAWGTMKVAGQGLVQLIVSQFTPYLTGLVKGFMDAGNATDSMGNQIKTLAGQGTFATWAYNIALYIAGLADRLVDAKNDMVVMGTAIGILAGNFMGLGQIVYGIGQIMEGAMLGNLSEIKDGWNGIKGAISTGIDAWKDFAATESKPPSTLYQDSVKAAIDSTINSEKAAADQRQQIHIATAAAAKAADAEYFAWYKNQVTSGVNDAKAAAAQIAAAETAAAQIDIANAKAAYAAHEITQQQELQLILEGTQRRTAAATADAQANVAAAKIAMDAWQAQANADIGNKNLEQKDIDQVTAATKAWESAVTSLAKTQGSAAKDNINALTAIQTAQDKLQKSLDAVQASQDKFTDSLKKTSDAQAFQNTLIGKSADEVAVLTAAYNAQQTIIQQLETLTAAADAAFDAGEYEKYNAIERNIALVRDIQGPEFVNTMTTMKQASIDASNSFATGRQDAFNKYQAGLTGAQTAQTAFNSLTTSMENLFVGFAQHSTNAFQTFKDSLIQMIEQIAAKLAVSGIFQLLGLGGGGGISSLLSGLGGSSGSSGGGGSILNDISGLLSGSSSGVGGIGGSLLDSLFPGIADTTEGVSALATGLTGLAGTIGTMIPYVGLAIGAFTLLSGIFSKGGGPKSGGYAETGGGGSFSNLYGGTGTSGVGGRAYTPNQDDSTLASAVAATQSSYNSLILALGGTAGGANTANFAEGYDTDPQGTAGNRITAGATVGGKSVYSVKDLSAGTDSATLQADLTQEAQRSLLSALQNSQLPSDITKILDSIDATTATSDQVTKVLGLAQAMEQMDAAVSGLGDPMKVAADAMTNAATPMINSITNIQTALQTAQTNFDGSATSLTALTTATANYQQAMAQAQLQIMQMSASINSMTDNAIKSFTMSTLDATDKIKYLQNDAAQAQDALAKATDPSQVAALTQQIQDDLTQAFGLLTPDQQAAQLNQYTAAEQQLNTLANNQLNTISTTLQNQYTTTIGDVKTLLSGFVDSMNSAATTQGAAANTNLTAAQTPKQLTLNVNMSTNGTEVGTYDTTGSFG